MGNASWNLSWWSGFAAGITIAMLPGIIAFAWLIYVAPMMDDPE
jgi:hypothetical protein